MYFSEDSGWLLPSLISKRHWVERYPPPSTSSAKCLKILQPITIWNKRDSTLKKMPGWHLLASSTGSYMQEDWEAQNQILILRELKANLHAAARGMSSKHCWLYNLKVPWTIQCSCSIKKINRATSHPRYPQSQTCPKEWLKCFPSDTKQNLSMFTFFLHITT